MIALHFEMLAAPSWRFWRLVFFSVLVAAALYPALSDGPLLSMRYDWRYFESMAEVARRSVVWYGQAPLWNPYSCGGEVDLANPQSLVGAPTFLFTLFFGTAWGFKLALALYYLLALGGMYKLAERLGLQAMPALFAAVSFGLSGYLVSHIAAGHINFASVALFPYLVYFFDRAIEDAKWILPTGALLAWVAVYGGTFTPALAGELLCLWALFAVYRPRELPANQSRSRRLLRALLLLFSCALVALLLGAYRMLPALEFIWDHPRPLFRRTPDMTPAWRLLGDLFAFRDYAPLPGRKYWSHEYTARLPQVLAAMLGPALLAAVRPAWRRVALGLAGLSLLAALLCMGNYAPYAPWSLLQKLPVLRDLRVPSRHLVLLAFFLALLGGIGVQALLTWLEPRHSRVAKVLGVLLVLVASLDAAAFTHLQLRGVFRLRLLPPSAPPPFYHVEGHFSTMRELIFAGHGVLRCDEEAPLQRADALDLSPEASAQARLVDATAGEVLAHLFTPNLRTITLNLRRTDTLLLLNSNWNEHFHIRRPAQGASIARVAGRLAVDLRGLSPGLHTIEVIYRPRSFTVGLALSLFCWPLFWALFWVRARRKIPLIARPSDRAAGTPYNEPACRC